MDTAAGEWEKGKIGNTGVRQLESEKKGKLEILVPGERELVSVNALIGKKVASVGYGLDHKTKCDSLMTKGVGEEEIIVWDIPCLQYGYEEEYLTNMKICSNVDQNMQ